MSTIAILVFPGVQALDVSRPLDFFAEANRFLPREQYYQLEVFVHKTWCDALFKRFPHHGA